MLRQLLTLLAVLSGFTLAAGPVTPAQASVVSVAQMAERSDCVVAGARPVELVGAMVDKRSAKVACPRPVLVIHVPAVMLRVDRSRE